MNANPAPKNPWKARVLLGTTVIASVAGISAFRILFARPGEASLRLVPANALIVATVDLSPGPNQVLAFKQIDDALERHGAKNKLESSLIDLFEPTAKGREALRPLVLRSGSLFVVPKEGVMNMEDPAMGAMLTVTSGTDALAALKKEGVAKYFRGAKYYKLKNGNSFYMVVDDLLVVSTEPSTFLAVKQVQNGAPSILSNPQFVSARGRFSDDANLMVFVSPAMADQFDQEGLLRDWSGGAVAIRDGSMDMKFVGCLNPEKQPTVAALGKIAPLRQDLLSVLPRGAYATIAIAQPSKIMEAMEGSIGNNEEAKKGIKEMEDGMRKETGIDFRKDLLPAFAGNSVLAMYPSGDSGTGADMLLVVDDSHDADPGGVMDHFVAYMDEQAAREGSGPDHFFAQQKEGDLTYASLDPEIEEGMNREMFGDGSDTGPFKPNPLGGSKTLAFAHVGKTVIAATSKDLLLRAVRSYSEKSGSLADDAAYADAKPLVAGGNHEVVAFSMSRIAIGMRKALDEKKLKPEDKKSWDAILGAFENLEKPLLTNVRFESNGTVEVGGNVPLDYARLFDFFGSLMETKD